MSGYQFQMLLGCCAYQFFHYILIQIKILRIKTNGYLNFSFTKGPVAHQDSTAIIMQCPCQYLASTCTTFIHLFISRGKALSRTTTTICLVNKKILVKKDQMVALGEFGLTRNASRRILGNLSACKISNYDNLRKELEDLGNLHNLWKRTRRLLNVEISSNI